MPTPIGPTFRGRSGRYFQEVDGPSGFWLTLFACVLGGLFLLMGLVSGAHFIPGVVGRVFVFLFSSVVLNLLLFVIHWGGLLVFMCGAVTVLWFVAALAVDRVRGRASLRQAIELAALAVPLAAFSTAHYVIFEHHPATYGLHPTAFHTLVVRFEHVLALVALPGVLWALGLWLAGMARGAAAPAQPDAI